MLGLTIVQAVELIRQGMTTAQALADAVRAGRAQVTAPLGPDEVAAHIDAAIAAAASAGDAAAQRIENRP